MPNAVSRLLARCVRGPHVAPHVAARARASSERLEERYLLALTITPVQGIPPASSLVTPILVPNSGINVVNSSWAGTGNQTGTYTGFDFTDPRTNTRLLIQDGVLLTNGQAANARGPNSARKVSAGLGIAGDPDLTRVVGFQTNDANSLTINFTAAPGTQSILFDFIFGSEEFPELVGSQFNDAFGAFLDGRLITFDVNNKPITVNNNFFRIDNTGGVIDVAYDGLTPRIRTQAPLDPALGTHTLKFAIADTLDTLYDSGVFISRLQGSPELITNPVTQLPNPGVFVFSQPDFSVDETGGAGTVTVSRVGGASGLVSVDYSVLGGSATAGVDFVPSTGTLVFADNQTSQTITIPVIDDPAPEGDETVQVQLSNAVEAGIGSPSTATLTILDNEDATQFTAAVYGTNETAPVAYVVVSRSGPLTAPASVTYATGDGSAVALLDYVPTSGTLDFAAGERTKTIAIPLVADFDNTESNERFSVTLSNAVGTTLGTQGTTEVEIGNVERPPTLYNIRSDVQDGAVRGLVLQFNEDLEPSRAQDPDNFSLFLHTEKQFNTPPTRNRVPLRAVEYDQASRTVTLRPGKTLRQNVFYEVFVRTTTSHGLAATGLRAIDGDFDGVPGGEDFVGYFGRGNRLNYRDRTGDKVSLALQGPGVMEVFRGIQRDVRTLKVFDAVPEQTSVSGKVTPKGRFTDRVSPIGQLVLSGATSLLNPEQFPVGLTIP